MKIYEGIKGIDLPETDFTNYDWTKQEQKENAYIEQLANYAKARNKGKYVGKEVCMPEADGYARYMIISEKPLEAVHIATGDAYESSYAHMFKLKDVKEYIDRAERIAKIFSKAREVLKVIA